MIEPTTTIILIEDDKQIRRFVRAKLRDQGMTVFEAETGQQGLIETTNRKPDLLVVDLGLPDRDGLDVIRDVRRWSEMPIIVLTARTGEPDKIAAFDAGADDYLTKPFGIPELLARIKVQFKRRNRGGIDDSSVVRFGPTTVNLATRIVTKDGKSVHLTPIEYRMLDVLVRHAGRVLTRRQLLTEVWGPKHLNDTHYLRIYMGSLRQKLERNAAQPEHLITETGIGYRLIGVQ
ncbi:sensor histidine kinase [Caballeronia glathei]|uniref:Fis family transcriptional regulator n=1 Tax=Caballeronia glathei TaxID=60547 RepID=A0A069PU79_9BURK|nr:MULTISPECIES: response regulator [Burkholderiaceae]KDR44333.1 Fis family transcriptional regulator [Caballeronia glathei]TCK34504.1 two-component system KDP operon response regulator KdpE [Paraburkholderia sp. BL8N3]CDY77621.1 sensor histidine kinase [Caballeronia glathei]